MNIILALYRIQEGTVKQIMEVLSIDTPYTTMASTVKNLERKKFVKAKLIGNTYLYTAAMSEAKFKKDYVDGVVQGFFANSYKELVNFFIDQKKLSANDLKDIINSIENEK
ncbi:MAG: transcriptional regulator [Pseudopedobacter saltans]|uniref:Transcriptional regulator n=1 Tax=Pseudopedobacter saltans TaxID=151895 RepID=A0A2W5ET29_9SPHI|nr:MAG: transcriptional regulator [Pseudopedobacter saltans]